MWPTYTKRACWSKITTWLKKDVFGGAALVSRPLHAINAHRQEFSLLAYTLKDFSHVRATHNFFLAPRLLVTGRQTHAIVSRQPAWRAGRDGCIPTCRWRWRRVGRRTANQTAAAEREREVVLILMAWFTGAANASRYRLCEFRHPRHISLAIKSVIIWPFSSRARMSEITPKIRWEFSPWVHQSALERIPDDQKMWSGSTAFFFAIHLQCAVGFLSVEQEGENFLLKIFAFFV